jgi:hypothetical protein
MKKALALAACAAALSLMLQPVSSLAQKRLGGENIRLINGISVSGIIMKFENQQLYVALNQQGATLIQRGQAGPGVMVIELSRVAAIEWEGRDDALKKRVETALRELQSDESVYQKITLFGDINTAVWETKTKYDYPGFPTSSTEKDSAFQLKIGPSYQYRRERQKDGYYIEARSYFDYDNTYAKKDRFSFAVTGINRFQKAQTGTESGTGLDPMSATGAATSITDYSIGGYKYYLGGTHYFAVGETQIGYDYRKASGEGGNDVPDLRFFFGAGWGKIFNIAGQTRAKTVEKTLMDDKVINRPFTRQMQKEIESLFERTDNPGVQTREIFQLLRARGFIAKEPTLEQSFGVMQMIEDSFSYRMEGLEAKGGLLTHMLRQADDISTTEKEKAFDPTLDIAGYVRYYKPFARSLQFTEEGILIQHTVPSPTSTIAFSNTALDWKYSRELFLTAYNLLVLMAIDFDKDRITAVEEVGLRGVFYLAEKVSINARLYFQYFNIEYPEYYFEYSTWQLGFVTGAEYTF